MANEYVISGAATAAAAAVAHCPSSVAIETLERNHPKLAQLFKDHRDDAHLFARIDQLMMAETFPDFIQLIETVKREYALFREHMNSLQMSPEQTWERFLNHRPIARFLFQSIKKAQLSDVSEDSKKKT